MWQDCNLLWWRIAVLKMDCNLLCCAVLDCNLVAFFFLFVVLKVCWMMNLGLGLLENECWQVVLGKMNSNGLKIWLKNKRKWNEMGSSMFYWLKFWAKAQTRKPQESNQNRASLDWFALLMIFGLNWTDALFWFGFWF